MRLAEEQCLVALRLLFDRERLDIAVGCLPSAEGFSMRVVRRCLCSDLGQRADGLGSIRGVCIVIGQQASALLTVCLSVCLSHPGCGAMEGLACGGREARVGSFPAQYMGKAVRGLCHGSLRRVEPLALQLQEQGRQCLSPFPHCL